MPDENDHSLGSSESPSSASADVGAQSGKVTDQDISPPRGEPFLIVGIGGSAGSLQAFTALLKALPATTGMAYVFVQHLDPHHESQLADILSSVTNVAVQTITDGMPVHPDQVYVMPPNTSVLLEDGKLRLRPRGPGLHLPVDIFFRSLALEQGSRAVGVVLSGNASDGSSGVRAIKEECGITFAQDEISARHSSMPRNAVATGAIDFVLPPEDIALELARLGQHPFVAPFKSDTNQPEILPDGESELKKIFKQLVRITRVDFSHYKSNTVLRRIGRRMVVNRSKNLAEYARYLEQSRSETQQLFQDLLISVTNFFRDPGAFAVLGKLISDQLANTSHDRLFRVWVPGCATGEEVYSLAILIQELIERLDLSTSFQIFGTDISDSALDTARSGIYSAAITNDVGPERLERFFVRNDGGYRVNKFLRENCIFARQNVAADSPFAHTDLISCRNVLIYMNAALQKRVLGVFHYSLNADGFLMLGSAESVGATPDLFAAVDKQHHIYSPKPTPNRVNFTYREHASSAAEPPKGHARLSSFELQKRADRILRTKYSPAAVVVDEDLQIIQFRGPTSLYFDPAPGEASLNLMRMAGEALFYPLRRAVDAAIEKNGPVLHRDIKVERREVIRNIDIEVIPIPGSLPAERYFLIVFQDSKISAQSAAPESDGTPLTPAADAEDSSASGEQELRRQLADTRDYLRNLREDHEAHSEELQAANEEVRSANEELQSTNEELSTTKEELQSANEELITVNEELQNRNAQLNEANNDLNNLLGGVSIAIVMVDSDLRIRRYNAAAQQLLDLGQLDVGRPVQHLHGPLEVPHLEQEVRAVLRSLNIARLEIQNKAGTWFSVTISPYRTADGRIEGAVIVFLDIDLLKRSLQMAEAARDFAEEMIETVREPLVVLDSDLRVHRATAAFYQKFQVSTEETVGRFLYDLGNGQWNRPRLRELLGNALYRDEPFQDLELEHDFPHIGTRTFRLNARRILRQDAGQRRVLLAMEDVTARREEADLRYHRLFESAQDGILLIDFETEKITDVNPFWLNLTGFPREEFVGKAPHRTAPFSLKDFSSVFHELRHAEVVRENEFPLFTRQGRQVDVECVANRYIVGSRQLVQVNMRPVTSRKHAAEELQRSEERYRALVDSLHDYAVFQVDLQGKISSWNTGAERVLGYTEREILGQSGEIVFTPEDREKGAPQHEIETAIRDGRAEDERWHVRRDGSRFFASGVMTTVKDGAGRIICLAKVMRDITERQQAGTQIEASLREKEVLLREIHHRVKNNLQMIVSLISLQSSYLKDPAFLGVLDEMRERIRSISAIHDMLYESADLSSINFSLYLEKMVRNLSRLHNFKPGQIDIQVRAEEIYLDVNRAIPCGLIINELLTNAVKHAFPSARKGRIEISFRSGDRDGCVLEVADDGVGFPDGLSLNQVTSMGLQLVRLLLEQLDAVLEMDSSEGSRFRIWFPCRSHA